MAKSPRNKAPDFNLLARHYLARGLQRHPDIRQHVDDVDSLDRWPMMRLMKLPRTMGTDVDALIAATEEADAESLRYSNENTGFSGVIEFDLTVELFGKRVTRKARAKYDYTPPWRYYDLGKQADMRAGTGRPWALSF